MRLYDYLFTDDEPPAGDDFVSALNPDSLTVLTGCRLEPMLAEATGGEPVQFERHGYFCLDPDSRPGRPVFNRTVSLRDTWARIQARETAAA